MVSMRRAMPVTIAIEGGDGSGKATQAQLLTARLRTNGFDAELLSFPNYESETGKTIRAYLNGEFGNPRAVHPKFISHLFAANKSEAWFNRPYMSDRIYVLDRFISSNLAHQAARLPEAEWVPWFTYWEQIERKVYHIPHPELTILLKTPTETRQELVRSRGNGADAYEEDTSYQTKVAAAYEALYSRYSTWRRVETMTAGVLDAPAVIADRVFSSVVSSRFI